MPPRLISASGSHYEIGRLHGVCKKEEIHSFLNDGLYRINLLLKKSLSLHDLKPKIDGFARVIREQLPDLFDEICGLSEGAGISLDEAILLQVRREIIAYQKIPSMGDCSTFALRANNHSMLGQTVDLNGNMEDFLSIIRVSPIGKNSSLVLHFSGLLGYLGVNEKGLAVGINLVMGGEWEFGVPPYLLVRSILDQASSLDDALAIVDRVGVSGSRSLMIMDDSGVANVEICNNEKSVVRDSAKESSFFHTNHFLHDAMLKYENINVFAKNSSNGRLRILHDSISHLAQSEAQVKHSNTTACNTYELDGGPPLKGVLDVESLFEVLSNHDKFSPICIHPNGNILQERTVAAVVIDRENRHLYLRAGNPCIAATKKYSIQQ